MRGREWLVDVLQAVVEDAKFVRSVDSLHDTQQQELPYEICVFCHAGVIRNLVLHLLGEAVVRTHPNAKFDTTKPENRLLIPNTSLAILELAVSTRHDVQQQVPKEKGEPPMAGALLVELNWAQHLDLATVEKTTTE